MAKAAKKSAKKVADKRFLPPLIRKPATAPALPPEEPPAGAAVVIIDDNTVHQDEDTVLLTRPNKADPNGPPEQRIIAPRFWKEDEAYLRSKGWTTAEEVAAEESRQADEE